MPKLLRGNTDIFLASLYVRSIFSDVIDVPAGDHHRRQAASVSGSR